MKNRVITISREFGSGGRTIGKKVAEKLGIPCYDAEIIQEMAKETGFAPDYVKEAGEYAPGSFLSSAFSNRMLGPTNEDILWEHQYKVITELAEKGSCVIVGRCADYILQDTADCLKAAADDAGVGISGFNGDAASGAASVKWAQRASV